MRFGGKFFNQDDDAPGEGGKKGKGRGGRKEGGGGGEREGEREEGGGEEGMEGGKSFASDWFMFGFRLGYFGSG